MENNMEGEQWCNICCKMVHPMNETENKCPFCDTEFVQVMENLRDQNDAIDLRSAWVFSLYAPIFLGLMGAFNPSLTSIASQESSSSSRIPQEIEQERENENENENENELVLVRRRRTSTYMMHLFRGLNVRMVSESENNEDNRNTDRNNSIVVIDPFNEGALIVRGPNMNHHTTSSSPIQNAVGTLNDFGVGSGFDLLLQHLAQIGTSGYAGINPPAKKEAIEAMPSVINEEMLQCTVCLEDVEIGSEVKEMPCKHKFHSDCIMSWLKLHCSCPVCRFQLPTENSAILANFHAGIVNNQNTELVRTREERTRNGRRNWFPVLQSFNNFHPFP